MSKFTDFLGKAGHVVGSIGGVINPIVGLAGGVASLLGSGSDRKSQEKINAQNIAMQRETNAQNYKMFQEANKFSHDEALAAFQREAEYNSPAAQMARYQAAGLNPFNVGRAAGSTSGNVDAATPSSVAPPNLQAPSAQMIQGNSVRAIDAFQGIASALKSLSDITVNASSSGKMNQETENMRTMLNYEIDEIMSRTKMQNAKANYDDVMNMLAQMKAPYEIEQMFMNCILLAAKGQESQANTALKKMQRLLGGDEHTKNNLLLPYVTQQAQAALDLTNEQVRTEKTKQVQNVASANEFNARAAKAREETSQLVDMHDDIVELTSLRKHGVKLDLYKSVQTVEAYIDLLWTDKFISDERYKEAKARAAMAIKDNDWYTADKLFNYVERINDGVNKWAPWAFSRTTTVEDSGESYNFRTDDYVTHENKTTYKTRGK